MKNLKSIGEFALGILIISAVITIVILFFYGAAWVGEKIIPVLEWIGVITFFLLVIVGTPLAFFRKTRIITGGGWYCWSCLMGITLWLCCLIATLQLWGVVAAIAGIIFLGVGIFATGLLAAAFHGEWSLFRDFIITLIIVFVARAIGTWLMIKSEPKEKVIELEEVIEEAK